jgi:hypothetical protein
MQRQPLLLLVSQLQHSGSSMCFGWCQHLFWLLVKVVSYVTFSKTPGLSRASKLDMCFAA